MAKGEYTTQNACDGCGCFGHCKAHRMPGVGVGRHPHVMIVGEAPGAQEDERGRPFVGPAGKMLVEGLRKAKYALPGDVYVRNAVSCRPTNGTANRTPSTDEIRRCHVFLRDDIERVRPNVILALGAVAASSLMGQTKVALKNVRMRKFDYVLSDGTSVPCYVTYHPSYIMRMQRESPATFKSLSVDWVRDLHAVLDAGRGTSTRTGVVYRIVKTEDRLVEFMRWLRDVKNPTAYDTEASNLNPFGSDVRLLTCAFSDRERFAWALPINHPEFHWRKHAMTDFVRALRNFFKRTDVVKIGANIKFDNNQIHRHLGVEVALPYRDVQFLQFCFDEERADNDLKTLAMAYTDMGAYDAALDSERERIEAQLKKDKRAYDKLVKAGTAPAGKSFEMRYDYLPLDMLLEYNAADADATIRVHNYLAKKLTPSLRLVANELMSRGGQFVERIEFNGAHIDQVAVESIRAKYTAEVDDTTRKLRASRPVQDFEASCLHELIEAEKEKKRPNIDRVLEKGFSFNPNSSAQLATVLFTPKDEGGFGFPVVARTEKGGEPSTNAEAMGELMRRYPDNKVLKALQSYREKTKVVGTYLEPALGEWVSENHDRFVRSTYNLRARTGRTTSSHPNLQNIPADVKPCFNSRWPGGFIVEADFSQVELRVMACLSRDPLFVDTYVNGGDLHLLTMCNLFNITPEEAKQIEKDDPKLYKRMRTIAKRQNFGILYGQGAPGLVDTLKGEGVSITVQTAQDYIRTFERTYKGVMRWIRKTHEFCREHGYVTTPFGRVRRLPLINSHVDGERVHAENQAQNTPVQGTASDLTLLSGWIASEKIKKSGLECKLCLTVHDSIEIDCKDKETAKEAGRILQSTMANCKAEIPEYTPFKTDWIIVPINSDVSYGPSWAEQKSLDEEESAA